VTFVFYFIDWL